MRQNVAICHVFLSLKKIYFTTRSLQSLLKSVKRIESSYPKQKRQDSFSENVKWNSISCQSSKCKTIFIILVSKLSF